MSKGNLFILNGETLIDLTKDSVTPDTLLKGVTAHDKSGEIIQGTVELAPHYAGKVTIGLASGAEDDPNVKDPTYNHFGPIPEDAFFDGMTKDGEYVELTEIPTDFSNYEYITYIHTGLQYSYDTENGTWRLWGADTPRGYGGNDVTVLDSIGDVPVTAITMIFDPMMPFDAPSVTNASIGTSVKSITEGAFNACSNLTNITYRGTVAEWESITFDDTWNAGCPAITVTCTDGTVTIPEGPEADTGFGGGI